MSRVPNYDEALTVLETCEKLAAIVRMIALAKNVESCD